MHFTDFLRLILSTIFFPFNIILRPLKYSMVPLEPKFKPFKPMLIPMDIFYETLMAPTYIDDLAFLMRELGVVRLLNLYIFFSVFVFIISVIAYLLEYISFNSLLVFNLFTIIGIAVTIISLYIISNQLKDGSNKYKVTYNYYFSVIVILISICCIILFLIIFKNEKLNFLNVLYILFGTLMISVVDKWISRRNQDEKSKMVLKRILSVVADNINLNIKLAEKNKEIIENNQNEANLVRLDSYFWDLIDSNIKEIDIDTKIIQDLLLLKHSVEEVNECVIKSINASGSTLNDDYDVIVNCNKYIEISKTLITNIVYITKNN